MGGIANSVSSEPAGKTENHISIKRLSLLEKSPLKVIFRTCHLLGYIHVPYVTSKVKGGIQETVAALTSVLRKDKWGTQGFLVSMD